MSRRSAASAFCRRAACSQDLQQCPRRRASRPWTPPRRRRCWTPSMVRALSTHSGFRLHIADDVAHLHRSRQSCAPQATVLSRSAAHCVPCAPPLRAWSAAAAWRRRRTPRSSMALGSFCSCTTRAQAPPKMCVHAAAPLACLSIALLSPLSFRATAAAARAFRRRQRVLHGAAARAAARHAAPRGGAAASRRRRAGAARDSRRRRVGRGIAATLSRRV